MNINHLIGTFPNLQRYLSDNHYCDGYIRQIERAFNFIIENNSSQWLDYHDIKRDYCISDKDTTNYGRQSALNVIALFDCYDILPSGKWKNNYFRKRQPLTQEFEKFIEFVGERSAGNCLSDSYYKRCIVFLRQFLFHLQTSGIRNFRDVKTIDVIEYFCSHCEPVKSSDSTNLLRHALEAGFNWSDDIRRIYNDIPLIHHRRKNIQYFTEDEIAALLKVLEDETTKLTFCERSFGYLLYYTGLRGCDIAQMKMGDIDWDKELIRVVQQKTNVPLTLPLPVNVGNMLYKYITEERPSFDSDHLFIRKNAPYRPYDGKSLGANICKKMYEIAGIRQEPKDRKGTHLFRHHFVKELLENGVSQPVISEMVGHTDPSSLEPYLNTDFVHLKSCALNIEKYPVDLGVFNHE